MKNPPEFDPYRTPASVDPVAPEPQEPQHAGYLKDPGFIGKAALTAISIQVLVKFAMAFTSEQNDWVIALTIAHVVAYLASMILYLVWIYQVALNVRRIDHHTDVKPNWAVGSYFIPFVNWVAPIVTMRSIIRVTFVHKTSGALPAVTVAWWLGFMVSNIVLRFSHDPVMFGLWALAVVVSWLGVIVLVTRISRCQADFPRPDDSPRFMMTPLSTARRPNHPPVPVRQIQPALSEPDAKPDIESGWGGG